MHPASDNLLHPIILNAPIGICILDANTLKIETVNEKFSQFFGKSPDSLHNKNYWSVLKEIKSYHEDALNNVIKTGEPYHENEVELILTRHGKCDQLFITFAYSPIKDNSGNIIKIAVWATERTAEVLARKELTDLNESLQTSNQQSVVNQLDVRNMIQQAPVGMCVVSGSPLYADEINDVFLEITGKTRDAFLRAPYWEVNAEARGVYEPIMDEVLRTGVTYRGKEHEVKLIRFGKEETVFVDFVFQPLVDAGGKISAAMIVATEVTDKVLARESLQNINNEMLVSNKEISASNEELSVVNDELATTQQQLLESLASVAESEERFRTMAESSGIFIAVSNHTGDATYFNNTWTELTGRKMDDLWKYGWTDLVHPEDINVYMNTYLDALKYKIPFTGEFRIHDKDNSYRWLLSTGSPRFRRDGAFAGYINSCIDISYSKQQEEERKQLLESVRAGERKLEQVIDQMPAHVVLLSGPDMIIESVNQQVCSFWKRTKEIIGKPLIEVLPELKGQPFPQQLDEVYATGKAIHRKESPVDFENEDGTIRKAFVDYSYQALFDATGKPSGVLVMSFEVTDKVVSRNLLEKYATDLQNANEELATTNEELIATNEELTATNEELAEMQANLQKSNTEIMASEANFRAMLLQAPVAMGLFKGIDMRLELINNSFLKLWNRDASIIGKTVLEALPEMRNQPYFAIMQDVFRTGETYYGMESEVYLFRNGRLDKGYYNFINHPFFGEDGTITGIIVVATEVTEQLNARHQLQQAEEMLRMAVEGARIGSWHIDPKTKQLKYNAMLAKLLGYEGKTPMTFEQAVGQVNEKYRPLVLRQIEKAISTGDDYDITFIHRRFNDGKDIWLRSLGRITPDEQGNYTIFSGVVLDITEQKADEQRKNDFIGMVSHELKTPLTSLTAIVQVAYAKLKNDPDRFLGNSMEKANVQVKKMANMINGFLNVSRLESGKMLMVKTDFSLDELIKETIHEHELTVNTHIIELGQCDNVQVNADRDKIGSVIANFISNAVKYSPKGTEIKIECRHLKDRVTLSVKDDGMGISAADLPHVFDRYFRVEAVNRLHISGFGIGLYLSAEIIKQHDGRIWAESKSGVVSTFYFSLPLF